MLKKISKGWLVFAIVIISLITIGKNNEINELKNSYSIEESEMNNLKVKNTFYFCPEMYNIQLIEEDFENKRDMYDLEGLYAACIKERYGEICWKDSEGKILSDTEAKCEMSPNGNKVLCFTPEICYKPINK